MKITITCDCGEVFDADSYDFSYEDTTKCSCGRCYGESWKIVYNSCPKCKKEILIREK